MTIGKITNFIFVKEESILLAEVEVILANMFLLVYYANACIIHGYKAFTCTESCCMSIISLHETKAFTFRCTRATVK